MTEAKLEATERPAGVEEAESGAVGAGTGTGTGAGTGTDAVGIVVIADDAPLALRMLMIRFCNSACLSTFGDSVKNSKNQEHKAQS